MNICKKKNTTIYDESGDMSCMFYELKVWRKFQVTSNAKIFECAFPLDRILYVKTQFIIVGRGANDEMAWVPIKLIFGN